MSGGTACSFRITSDIKIKGPGILVSETGSVTIVTFGLDGVSGTASLSIDGLGFSGGTRYRAIFAELSASVDTTNLGHNDIATKHHFDPAVASPFELSTIKSERYKPKYKR